MGRFSQIADKLFKKMEDYAKVEGTYLTRRNSSKLRLIGLALGIVFVGLMALWMAHHP